MVVVCRKGEKKTLSKVFVFIDSHKSMKMLHFYLMLYFYLIVKLHERYQIYDILLVIVCVNDVFVVPQVNPLLKNKTQNNYKDTVIITLYYLRKIISSYMQIGIKIHV